MQRRRRRVEQKKEEPGKKRYKEKKKKKNVYTAEPRNIFAIAHSRQRKATGLSEAARRASHTIHPI